MRLKYIFHVILCAGLLTGVSSCEIKLEEPLDATYGAISMFGINTLDTYYLWNEEIGSELEEWRRHPYTDPIAKVQEIRYKKGGKDYDRWTQMTDDIDAFQDSIEGLGVTYGCDFQLMWYDNRYNKIIAVITLVYKDSPAEKAGLKRGDAVSRFNGKEMYKDNYSSVVADEFYSQKTCTLTLIDQETGKESKTISLEAVQMYEDPVLLSKIFTFAGKKVGYLVFTSFTNAAIPDLIEVCKGFKKAGVTELILDLRYNGGGYVTTEEVLASMLAPQEAVRTKALLSKDVYNDGLTRYYIKERGANALNTYFKTVFNVGDTEYDTSEANFSPKKIYAIVSGDTASASESLLVELMPYVNIKIIGEQTHGKFCSGIIYSAKDWYEDYQKEMSENEYLTGIRHSGKWGLYLMIGTYSDKNGNNPACPDGLVPDVVVSDQPYLGYQLGDERESMLHAALYAAGRTDFRSYSTKSEDSPVPVENQFHKASFGMRIKTH